MLSLAGRTTVLYLNRSKCESINVLLPPIEEQGKIAEILGTWDSAIALTENLIAAKQKKKRYFIKRFFQSSDSDNLFDKAKKLIKLREVVTKIGSGITPRGGRKVYLSEGIALIRSQNVQSGYLDISDVVFIDETQHFKMQNSKVYPSDVLLNITGASIGRSCVVPKNIKEANVNQHVCILRPSQKINPHYLSIFLNSYQGQKQILSFQVGGSREGLNYQQVSNLRLNLPSIDEQNKIANFLACLEHEIRLLGFIREKFKLQKRGLMQKLLTGEWRVKIEKAGQQLTELKT
jgi:type I restriction enzyme S subunit